MSRVWQATRAAEREQEALDRDLDRGWITSEEHRRASREIERDVQAAHADDLWDAQQAVRDEWGW